MQLTKIKRVYLYTAICPRAGECWDILEALRGANVEYVHMHYSDDVEMQASVDALKTWTFHNGTEEIAGDTIVDFPLVIWDAYYDDDEGPRPNVVKSLAELQNSQLMNNLDKVV